MYGSQCIALWQSSLRDGGDLSHHAGNSFQSNQLGKIKNYCMRIRVGSNHGSEREFPGYLGIERCKKFHYRINGLAVNRKLENRGCMLNYLNPLTRIRWQALDPDLIGSEAFVIPMISQFSGIMVDVDD